MKTSKTHAILEVSDQGRLSQSAGHQKHGSRELKWSKEKKEEEITKTYLHDKKLELKPQ